MTPRTTLHVVIEIDQPVNAFSFLELLNRAAYDLVPPGATLRFTADPALAEAGAMADLLSQIVYEMAAAGGTPRERLADAEGQILILQQKAAAILSRIKDRP